MDQKSRISQNYILGSKNYFQYLKGIAILRVLVAYMGNYSEKTCFTPLGGIGVVLFLLRFWFDSVLSLERLSLFLAE